MTSDQLIRWFHKYFDRMYETSGPACLISLNLLNSPIIRHFSTIFQQPQNCQKMSATGGLGGAKEQKDGENSIKNWLEEQSQVQTNVESAQSRAQVPIPEKST